MSAAAAPVFEPRSRPPFRERVLALAGHGAFREPTPPGTQQRTVPADHMIAAALAYGRRGPEDVGPDVAVAMATGTLAEGQRLRALTWLGHMLASERSGACKRLRPYAAHYAVWAWNAATQGMQPPPAPEGVAEQDHGECLLFACLLLEQVADDALALAARRWRG